MITAQEQILNEFAARLANIKISNSYSVDVATIKRSKLDAFQQQETPIIYYWGEQDTIKETLHGMELRSLMISLGMFTRSRETPYTDLAYQMAADIKTVLNRSVNAPKLTDPISIALGGLINSLTIEEILPVIGEGQTPFCGVLLTISADYQVEVYDSFTILN